jgi:hypothetical protein
VSTRFRRVFAAGSRGQPPIVDSVRGVNLPFPGDPAANRK